MSAVASVDPAIQAAQRAWTDRYPSGYVQDGPGSLVESAARNGVGALIIEAAREALKPIRELHKPVTLCGVSCCQNCRTQDGAAAGWPCRTARLIYTAEELS